MLMEFGVAENDTLSRTLHRVNNKVLKHQFSVSPASGTIFFPDLFFYVYIESPNPYNPEGLTPQAPHPINWKPQPQKPNIKPQPQNPKPP